MHTMQRVENKYCGNEQRNKREIHPTDTFLIRSVVWTSTSSAKSTAYLVISLTHLLRAVTANPDKYQMTLVTDTEPVSKFWLKKNDCISWNDNNNEFQSNIFVFWLIRPETMNRWMTTTVNTKSRYSIQHEPTIRTTLKSLVYNKSHSDVTFCIEIVPMLLATQRQNNMKVWNLEQRKILDLSNCHLYWNNDEGSNINVIVRRKSWCQI